MSRFTLLVAAYLAICIIVGVVIVLRGEGPSPRIVAVYPHNGDGYWPGGTAQITFSYSMDQTSVERSLEVTPGSQGQGSWFGNTLNIQPVGDWRPNTTYHVRFVGKVIDTLGRAMHTPVAFWFRVHHVARLVYCPVARVRNVCEAMKPSARALTHSPTPVTHYALSSDGSELAYTRTDASGLPHLFVIGVDGTGSRQLTYGSSYSDGPVWWAVGDNSTVTYDRRPVVGEGASRKLGKVEVWNVQIDGTGNTRFS